MALVSRDPEHPYVSRGGLKLAHALESFQLDVTGYTAADLGCSVGGFTDCLLQHGASQVFAVDTAYGLLDWKLRSDDRVVVLERKNALHLEPGEVKGFPEAGLDCVVIDLGWTPQRLALPVALRWLADEGCVLTLIKPQYEAAEAGLLPEPDPEPQKRGGKRRKALSRGVVLDDDVAQQVCDHVLARLPELGVTVEGCVQSPVRGGVTRGQAHGNIEFIAMVRRAQ